MITEEQVNCQHDWAQFSIAMLGIRWQCTECDLIAPACFVPIATKTAAEQFLDDHVIVVNVP